MEAICAQAERLGGSVLLAPPFSYKKVEALSKACVSHYRRRFFTTTVLKNCMLI